jgi:non-ribosomal peptide synthetase component F
MAGAIASTLHATLREAAKICPGRSWLRFEGASWSYAEGDALSDKIAGGLAAQGITSGDRVALLFTNSTELVFCYFACFKIGAVAEARRKRDRQGIDRLDRQKHRRLQGAGNHPVHGRPAQGADRQSLAQGAARSSKHDLRETA